jgi:diaminohydroxyphosphoribosylaminopyrimidine deaminase/5-amino-6-(5-phosphoribosylamino)uracil reductase
LYVSLEPCAHFGKTPPCADLIIEKNIPEMIIGCRDPFVEVNGKGIEKLMAAGVKVITGVLENDCKELNKCFFKFQEKRRPYIILKWAQTGDCKMASLKKGRLLITNEFTNRIVHKWRSQQQSILIGTNTALFDDPELTTRLWAGNNPLRMVIDLNLRLPSHLKLFNGEIKTIVINLLKHEQGNLLSYYQVTKDVSLVHQILNALYKLNIQSVIVEGGGYLTSIVY